MIERIDEKDHSREVFFDTKIKPIVRNPLVAEAFRRVDRKLFIPEGIEADAYKDAIIKFGDCSSMSQPTLMARMLDRLELTGAERTLEIGTASGYNAALLSHCSLEVHTVEYNPQLAERALARLQELGYANVHVHIGDGAQGIPGMAPFDRIIITAAVREFPQPLFDQLSGGGIVVGPIGETKDSLQLAVGKKVGDTLHLRYGEDVDFYLLQTSEHGGWSEEARAKERSYSLSESGKAIPQGSLTIDIEEESREPRKECFAILTEHGLTEQQFIDLFQRLGKPEEESRKLLTLHPEAFEVLVNLVLPMFDITKDGINTSG